MHHLSRLGILAGTCLIAALAVIACNRAPENGPGATAKPVKTIGIVYTAPHEIINQIIAGFKEEVVKNYADSRIEFVERHANGDVAQASTTVNAVLNGRVDLLAPITTPIAIIGLKNSPSSVPVCFLGITDPQGAGLVDSLEKPVKCTGVSDLAPYGKTLELIRKLLPSAKTVGYPYNPEDEPAVFGLKQVKALAPQYQLTIVEMPIVSKDELLTLFNEVFRSSDCAMIGSDNLMFEAAPTLIRAGQQAKKPVFAADSTSIQAGAVGGYTIDYRLVGVEGGRIAAEILKGKKAGELSVITLKDGFLELNVKSAELLKISLPADLVARAKTLYGKP